MSLQVGQALQDGVDELTSERGLLFVAVFVIFGLVNQVVSQSLSQSAFRTVQSSAHVPSEIQQQQEFGTMSTAFGVDLPLSVAVTLMLVVLLAGVVLRVLAIRAFATEGTSPLPASVTRNLAKPSAIAVTTELLLFAGAGMVLALLFAPGILLPLWLILAMFLALGFMFVFAVATIFVTQEIAINDSGVIASITNSIHIARTNLVGTSLVLVVTFIVGVVITLPVTVLAFLFPPTVASVLQTVLGQVASVFAIAVITSAYVQATADDDGFGAAEEGVGTAGNGFDTSDGV